MERYVSVISMVSINRIVATMQATNLGSIYCQLFEEFMWRFLSMETVAKINGSLSFQGHRNNKEEKVGGEMLGESVK